MAMEMQTASCQDWGQCGGGPEGLVDGWEHIQGFPREGTA